MNPVRLIARNGANGLFSVYLTVLSSTLSIDLSGLQSKEASVSRFGSAWIFSVEITSSAVIGVPSVHLAPFLIFTVQTVPSLETCGIPSAKLGTMFRFLSPEYRFGKRNLITRADGRS